MRGRRVGARCLAVVFSALLFLQRELRAGRGGLAAAINCRDGVEFLPAFRNVRERGEHLVLVAERVEGSAGERGLQVEFHGHCRQVRAAALGARGGSHYGQHDAFFSGEVFERVFARGNARCGNPVLRKEGVNSLAVAAVELDALAFGKVGERCRGNERVELVVSHDDLVIGRELEQA